MRTRMREKRNTRRRQEQEYRDKILTLNKPSYSEVIAPKIKAKEIVPPSDRKASEAILHAPRELHRLVLPVPRQGPNLALLFLAYGLGIVGLGINAWFAWNRGSTLPDKLLLSSLGFIAEAIMFYLLSQAATVWARRQLGKFLVACLVWPILFVFALTNSLGFASVNFSETTQARVERVTPAVSDAQRRLDTLSASRVSECVKRGDKCRQLEKDEQHALEQLREAREKVFAAADPQLASATKLIAWATLNRLHPSADDFTMLRLLLLTLLPQLGGLVLMIAKSSSKGY